MQLMDLNLIVPGGAIIVDNTLMKVVFNQDSCLHTHVFIVCFMFCSKLDAFRWKALANRPLNENSGNQGQMASNERLTLRACRGGHTTQEE